MERLALLPFLQASSSPAALFHVDEQLKNALVARQQAGPLQTPTLHLRRFSLTTPKVEAEPALGAAAARDDQGDYFSVVGPPSDAGLTSALRMSFANASLLRWLDGLPRGGRDRPRTRFASDDTVMDDNGNSAPSSPTDPRLDFSDLPTPFREDLLQFLLDTLESLEYPQTPDGTPPALQLGGITFSATISLGFILLLGTTTSHAPVNASLGVHSATPPTSLTSASFLSLALRPTFASTDDSYLDSLRYTPMSRMIRDHDWSKSELVYLRL